MIRLAAALAALLAGPSHSSAVTFADGQVHIIDAASSFPLDDVEVLDGPGGSQTTVRLVEGGQIGSPPPFAFSLIGYGSSDLYVDGGSVSGAIRLKHSTQVHMSDGSAGTVYIDTQDNRTTA